MIYLYIILSLLIAYINAAIAKKRGYFFWRSFFFTLILAVVVFAIVYKELG